jgi:hypothetical protein
LSVPKSTKRLCRSSSSLNALIPLAVDEMAYFLNTRGVPTASQYSAYWGRTSREQYSGFLESALVTFLGVFFAYFLSFVIGNVVATLLGFLFAMWTLLSPEIRAYQRNWELLAGRSLVDPWSIDNDEDPDQQGLYGALFLGILEDVAVVESASSKQEYDLSDFQDYAMENDDLERSTGLPYLLRVRLLDSEGRSLQVHARMSEEYLDLRPGQTIAGVLLSTSQSFSQLAALTDFVVPDAECWIGDYPYLDRPAFEAFLYRKNPDLWDLLEQERDELEADVGVDYEFEGENGQPRGIADEQEYSSESDDDYYGRVLIGQKWQS